MKLVVLSLLLAASLPAQLLPEVKAFLAAGDFHSARTVLTGFRREAGVTPEYLEAYSWIGRADLAHKYYPQALGNASEVYQLCVQALATRKLAAEPQLATALGASIEVKGQALAAQGHLADAVAFLQEEEARWRATSIRARIRKNLNLLNLEGKAAPPLDTRTLLTPARPARAGHPVLMFFWAHWCSDCKQQVAVIAELQAKYGPKGLVVVAPTQTYGYAAGGVDVAPAAETQYIRTIRKQYYAPLGDIEIPLSNENFGQYGVSTTPTLVLLDDRRVVRMYHPGIMTFAELSARIEPLLARRPVVTNR